MTPPSCLAPSSVELPADFPAQEITFTGGDNLKLSGWYIEPHNDAVVILLHGYDANRTQLLWQARQLLDAGFGILLYDLRGHGESEGEQRTNGWRDVDDVAAALTVLDGRAGNIGIYGFSIGGQVALRAAAELPTIHAVFVDGPAGATAADYPAPANIQEQFIFRLAPIADRMLSDRTGTPIPNSVVDALPTIAPRPIYFVATGQHPQIPGGEIRLIKPFYELVKDHAQWWEIPEAGHGGGWQTRAEEYAMKLTTFFAVLEQSDAN
ncbi:MAG: alpha/beta hydrolase [Anaerolineae bacterium]